MKVIQIFESQIDQTLKYRFNTEDDGIIEACVVFFEKKEATINICISTQLGCECLCTFCTTGNKRFIRNLSSLEIQEQVKLILDDRKDFRNQKFEITFMGTGEPLKNKENVLDSARCFAVNYKSLVRINISTIFDSLNLSLNELNSIGKPIHFQYSLHFCDDETRSIYFRKKMAPINEVLRFLDNIADYYGKLYCVNYILFDSINDDLSDAHKLVSLIKGHKAYLKISEFCPILTSDLQPSKKRDRFVAEISKSDIPWKVFSSHGTDIHAACGHLLTDIIF